MHRLAISLLGPFAVTLDGEPVTRFGADSARALLAYLAMHPHTAHRRETLAGLLWPDQPEAEARHNLAQALLRLRQAIGDRTADPPFLDITRQTIGLDPHGDISVDVVSFREALAVCQVHKHRRIETCDACAQQFEEAADLYRGSFLQGFSLDSALFEEWMVVEREELHRGALEVLHSLAAIHEAQGAYDETVAYGRRQLELEPWRESAHRQVMRALALSGDRAGALAQYEVCREALEVEFGIGPDPETTALYERIRDGEELAAPETAPPSNLPIYLTPFVGREKCLAEIEEYLADPVCRLLTLVGPGGIGKTRLAVEAAGRQLDSHEDGVFFVPLASVGTVEAIVPTVCQAIGLLPENDPQEGRTTGLKGQLLDHLRDREMLLILDNYEHLIEGAGLVTEILRAASRIRIVTTSRARLNVRGEHLLSVGGMHHPKARGEPEAGIDRYSAVQLFVTSARETRPDFYPSGDDLAQVGQICRLVEGMPLAILLASAWVRMLPPSEIASEIEQGIDFLSADWRDVPERQRSIRAVFDRSWQLLTDREQEILSGLSVFHGGFTRSGAEQVVGASLRELMALVDRSLLHRGSNSRYELHELLRQYAEERRGEFPDQKAAMRERHAAYFAACIQQWKIDLDSPRALSALAQMDAEIENARAAWNWAAERNETEWLDQAVSTLRHFYVVRGRWEEGLSAFGEVAQRVSKVINQSPTVSAGSLLLLANVLSAQGLCMEREANEQLQGQAMALLERPQLAGHDVREMKAWLLLTLGNLHNPDNEGRDSEKAARYYTQSLALYRDLRDQTRTARALEGLARVAWNVGDYDQSRRLLEESLEISQVASHPAHTFVILMNLAYSYLHQGQLERGEYWMQRCVAWTEERLPPLGVMDARTHWGNTLWYQGRYAEARPLLRRALAYVEGLSDPPRLGIESINRSLGQVEMHLGQYNRARSLGERALKHVERPRNMGLCRSLLGNVALAQGRFSEARSHVQEGAAVSREIGQRNDLSVALAVQAIVDRSLGEPDQARQSLSEALHISSRIRVFRPCMYGLAAYALLLVDQGRTERSCEMYAVASDWGYVANSRWFEDVAGRHISAVAGTLPADVVAAAQERGRARDLWATVEEVLEELAHPDSA